MRAARERGGEEKEGGAFQLWGASVADVRQTPREAVEAQNLSRAKGGPACAIGQFGDQRIKQNSKKL